VTRTVIAAFYRLSPGDTSPPLPMVPPRRPVHDRTLYREFSTAIRVTSMFRMHIIRTHGGSLAILLKNQIKLQATKSGWN
jgi:hypothetical protein